MAKQSAFSGVEPLAVRTADAMRMAGIGKTKLFQLVKSGEYESYLDGRIRLITTASIRARIQRKLESQRTEDRP
jgi:hypothetical protein